MDLPEEDLPEGPSTLGELFQWHHSVAKTLFGDDASAATLAKLSGIHVMMSSEFTGMGSAELALQMVANSINQRIEEKAGGLRGR